MLFKVDSGADFGASGLTAGAVADTNGEGFDARDGVAPVAALSGFAAPAGEVAPGQGLGGVGA